MSIERRVVIPAVFAFASAAFYLAALTSKERALTGDYAAARVLSAAVDIPERTVLTPAMLTVVEIPRRFVAQDAIEARTPADVRMAAGLIARVRIPKGNQVGQSALTPPSPGAGLAVKVPPGYRGASLDVAPETARLLKPGDLGPGAGRRNDEADARSAVLSEKTALSLALNPLELQYLALAQKQGETTIGVRGLGDDELHSYEIAHLGALFRR